MAAACPLGVVGVDRAALERGQRVLDEARLVERIGVDRDLDVEVVGHLEAGVDGGRGRAPVLVELEPHGTGGHLLLERRRQAGIALAEEAQVHREGLRSLQHARDVPRSGRAGGGVGAGRRSGAAAQHRGDAGGERLLDLLGADEVDVGIDAAGGDDLAFSRDGLRAGPDDHVDPGLGVRVPGLADGGDAAVLDADVRLVDAARVQHQCVGDHRVHGVGRSTLALAHAVANDLAAAELHLVAVDGVVRFDLDDEFGVAEPYPVAGGGAEHLGVGPSGDGAHGEVPRLPSSKSPMIRALNPNTRRAPAKATRVTVRR